MWVIKFPNGQYYWVNMVTTPFLHKAKIYRTENKAKDASLAALSLP